MYTVKRFHCGFCKKTLSKKSEMAAHEKICPLNPESRSCGTCSNFERIADENGREIPHCAIGKMTPNPDSHKNPYGMKSNCIFHHTKNNL